MADSTQRNDGGPAFATSGLSGLPNGEFVYGQVGMTLRDYAAIHSTQPGVEELVQYAGFRYDGIFVYLKADDSSGPRFNDWWRGLSLERKCELFAGVRYVMADAMLKARQS